MKEVILLGFIGLLAFGCAGNEASQNEDQQGEGSTSLYVSTDSKEVYSKAQTFFKPLPAVAENSANPITDQKVKLGKVLFLDNRLSKDGSEASLTEVIRIMGILQLNKELTVKQINKIEVFLNSLTGDLPTNVTS